MEKMPRIEVQVDPRFRDVVDDEMLVKAAAETLESEGVEDAELTIVVTDDERVRDLNREYRGVDEPTDVLSFQTYGDDEFVESPEAESYLGDVVIAYPFTAAQAMESGRSVKHDLALMVVHGVLHLLGYDHSSPEEEKVMWDKQNSILERLTLDEE